MNDRFFNFFFYGVFALVIIGSIAYAIAIGFVVTHTHELAKETGTLAHDFMQGLQGSGSNK